MIFSLHFVCLPISFSFPLYSLRDTYSLFLSDHFSFSWHHINAIFIVEVGRIYRILFNEYLSLLSRLPYCPLLAFSFPSNHHPPHIRISSSLIFSSLFQWIIIDCLGDWSFQTTCYQICETSTYALRVWMHVSPVLTRLSFMRYNVPFED